MPIVADVSPCMLGWREMLQIFKGRHRRHERLQGRATGRHGITQTTIRGGRPLRTALCYPDPVRRRSNLKIHTNTLTECLLFCGKRGVADRIGAKASRMILVAAA